MEKILLNDLLKINEDLVRVKFNTFNGTEEPLEVYQSDQKEINDVWLLWYSGKRYFPDIDKLAICLVRISGDLWLLTTVKRIKKILWDVENGVGYEADEIEAYKKYYGRVIIRYHKSSRTGVRLFDTVKDELEVVEILNSQYTGEEFSGYDN